MKKTPCAEIDKNTDKGVYGTISDKSFTEGLRKIAVGEAKMGNASIITTIDGSEPNSSSLVYEKPFRVPVGTTVKAISTLAGFANSEVAEDYAE